MMASIIIAVVGLSAQYPDGHRSTISAVANVNSIYFGSDHSQGFIDRATADFGIPVTTTKADADSNANTWKKVYTHDGAAISKPQIINVEEL